jgi:N-acetylneuraminic acid mutarotase
MAHSAITKNNIQQNNKWTIEIPMPTARHGLAAASFGDRIFVIGGGPQPGGSAVSLNETFPVNSGR